MRTSSANGCAGTATLTFPGVRAVVQDVFTELLFAAKPSYTHWMEQAKRERASRGLASTR